MCAPPAAHRNRGGTGTRCAVRATRPPSLQPFSFRLLYSQRGAAVGLSTGPGFPRPSPSVSWSRHRTRVHALVPPPLGEQLPRLRVRLRYPA